MQKCEDYPTEQCAKQAAEKIANGAIVFQKWSCQHCGSRQTMDQPNEFFASGHCEECGQITDIEKCNYMAIIIV